MKLEYVDRRNSDSMKWDGLLDTFKADGLLPLWVADMDFRIDEHITDALMEYVKTGVPGYYKVPDAYYDAFIKWEKEEHGLEVKREWIRFSPGVVTGFHMALQMLTYPGDAVLITTPVYYPFINAIKNNDRQIITSELVNDNGRYTIDFADFESKIKKNDVSLFILCSPHNPVSRVWTEGELTEMLRICRKYNVRIISDEIHHDLVFGGSKHVPTLSLACEEDKIIMMTAVSKSFNLAGFQNSFVVIKDDELRGIWDKYTTGNRVQSGNPLGYIAARTAYEQGKPWLEEVKKTIEGNFEAMSERLKEGLPDVVITPLEGTYLAWIDFGAYLRVEELQAFMQDRCGLAFDYGQWFGGGKSGTHIRVNLATSRENVLEAADRIIRNLKAFKNL